MISNPPKFHVSLFIDFFLFEAKKTIFLKKSVSENMDFKTFLGPWGATQLNFFSKTGSKSSTITRIKKSLTFEL